jgi:signal transduction histidine kinase
MTGKRRYAGIAFQSSPDGTVTQVLYDGLDLGGLLGPSCRFCELLDAASVEKGRHFLQAVRDGHEADVWTLDVRQSGRRLSLLFSGIADERGLTIMGACTPAAAAKIRRNVAECNRAAGAHQAVAEQGGNGRQRRGSRRRDLYSELRSMNKVLASAQRELMSRNIELEKMNEEKMSWLGMAAHDLQHPIGAVMVYSELLIEDPANAFSEDQKTMIQAIHSSSEFMLLLLNDVVDISAVESRTLRLSPESAKAPALLRESVSLCGALASRKQTKIELRCAEPMPPVTVDWQKMRQVFVNLIGNAIKYSQNGASIEIDVLSYDGNALISIRDNGPGIPPDELKELFTPFQKTRARATSAEPGTGLGLAIAKRIVERHSGRIWAESTIGHGATFYVSLPHGKESRDTVKSLEAGKARASSSMQINAQPSVRYKYRIG